VVDPLWRGLVGYRVLAWCYAAVLVAVNHAGYRWPLGGVLVLAGMGLWTAVTSLGYLRVTRVSRMVGRRRLAVADLAVTVLAVAGTLSVETAEHIAGGEPVLATVWAAGPVLAMALTLGAPGGLLGAVLVQAAVLTVRGHLGTPEVTDLLLMLGAALAVGYAATVLRASAERLRQATELRAALAERERLARAVHDGVLQVLAQVKRRGTELGGPAAELGELAGEQEVSLRTLVARGAPRAQPAGRLDLAARLGELATPRVTVSAPAGPVPVPSAVAVEVAAAVAAALANVQRHVGPDAPAWVLLEDLGDHVEVSVRDDGPGIPAGRLAEAEADGRLGVARSIRGRVEGVGGTVRCDTAPGQGCEWIFEVPLPEPGPAQRPAGRPHR
jgi:signal transduction histidine kinase